MRKRRGRCAKTGPKKRQRGARDDIKPDALGRILPRALSAHFGKVRGRFPRGFGPVSMPVRNRAQMRIFLVLKLHRNQKPAKGGKATMQDNDNKKAALPPKALRMTVPEAAAYIPMNRRTLKEYWQQRRIPYYKIGFRTVIFDVRDLDAFIAKRRVEALG